MLNWVGLPEYGCATRNSARDIPFLKSYDPDGHRIWSEADVAKFEKRHPIGTKARWRSTSSSIPGADF
jgi:hypothetical protein